MKKLCKAVAHEVVARSVIAMVILGGAFSLPACADSLLTTFYRANLSPANEVPAVTSVSYSGRATIALHVRRNDAGAVTSAIVDFDVDYNFGGDTVTVQGLHIHTGAAGVNGPVVIDSGLSATNTVVATGFGNIFRQVRAESDAQLAAINNILSNPAGMYVNLHTSVNPGGVMRDQMKPMEQLVLRAELDPANEVPPVVGLAASGSGSVFILAVRNDAGMITEGTLQYDVSVRFPTSVTIRGLHIHPGAAGVNGPAVLDSGLSATNTVTFASGTGILSFKVQATSGQSLDVLRSLFANPANAYLNVHTTDNPGGAMRGQLMPTTETSLQFPMSSQQENPPVQPDATAWARVSIFAARDATGTVTSATAIYDVNYNFPGATIFRGFHIHTGAVGVNGPVVIDSGLSAVNSVADDDGVGNLFKIIDVPPSNTAGVAAVRSILTTPENQYLNLHTTVNPGGAIRGQLVTGTPPPPVISRGGIVNATNAASVAAASPGSLITIYGTNQARVTGSAAAVAGRLPTNIEGTEVRIGGAVAPLLYVSPLQINAQVPFEIPVGTQTVTVTTPGGTSAGETLSVSAVSPAIFVAVKNSDFSLTTASNPARPGDVIAVFCTGLGTANPSVATGQLAPASPLSNSVAVPTATIGGVAAQVVASVLAPGFVGVYQVNVVVPPGVPAGAQPLRISVGGQQSNAVTINLQSVTILP